MSEIRAALFGVTHPHSLAHLQTLQALDEVTDIVLWDDDEQTLEKVRRESGDKVRSTYTDRQALLDKEQLLFAVVALPNDRSKDVCLQLADAGVHILCEKPIGKSAAEAAVVVSAAEQAAVKLGVMYQNRYTPVHLEARRLRRAGVIGEVTSCEGRMVTSQVRFRNPKHWLFDAKVSGGGILSWLGCHYIDLFRYILDDEVSSVMAFTDTLSGEAIDVEDTASVVLRFRGGALGTLSAGYQLAISQAGYAGGAYDTYMGFRGREGRLFWSRADATPTLHVESVHPEWHSAPQRKIEFAVASGPGYGGVAGQEFVRRFIQSAQGDGDPVATGWDALQVARIVEAAYESSRTGRRVDLD